MYPGKARINRRRIPRGLDLAAAHWHTPSWMHGSGRSQGWLVHLLAGAALGAVVVLVIWIFSGGRPFGEVVGTSDVSSTTPAATAKPASDPARLVARPPAIAAKRPTAELRFIKPKAKRHAKAERKVAARKPKRTARRKKARRGPVVRVVAPPAEEQTPEAPVAVVPSPTAAPVPVSAPPSGGARPAKPRNPGPTLWAGEG